LFKRATKFPPTVSSNIVLEAFELALEIRRVDMRASPYDVSAYGLDPIAVETHEGKREYAELQGDFARRGGDLRARIVASVGHLRERVALPTA